MANTLQFDLVSPERRLASVLVTEVLIPGADGDMTAMANHAATITSLRPGLLTVTGPEGKMTYAVTGGFADITAASTSVLAERAVPLSEVTAEMMDGLIADATTAAAAASVDARDVTDKLLADLQALRAAVGV